MTTNQKIITIYYILKHKIFVLWYIFRACKALIIRGIKHDNSKFSKEEFEYVYILSTSGKKVKFGSKKYYKLVDSIMSAKMAHANKNSHHPEFYNNDIYKMSYLEILEMLSDWAAATKRSGGNLKNSLKINKKKYSINKKMEEKLKRDMSEIGLWKF